MIRPPTQPAGRSAVRQAAGLPPLRAQPDDGLAARALSVLASEQPPRAVADWLAFLSRTAPADVAGRLERAGYLVAARRCPGVRRGGGPPIPTVPLRR